MANVLPFRVRCSVVRALCEGNGIRDASRVTGADKDVVSRLGAVVGKGCAALHSRIAGDALPGPPDDPSVPRSVAGRETPRREELIWLRHFWRTFVQTSADGATVATRAGVTDRPWLLEDMVRAALEEAGEASPEPSLNARRRYQRKTHASATL